MKINFYEEVLKRKDEILKDTQEILRINSELTEYDPKSKYPFGKGIDDSLRFMLDLAKKDGFDSLYVDGYAGHIELGDQEEFVGMVGHIDVVPAGEDWDYPPYGAEIVDGKIYARGAEDDKGPTVAAYYAMKIIKELNLPLSKRIKLILGTDEETAWRGVNYYFDKFPEQPVYGFIPDADFPLTYAEKGIVDFEIKGKDKPGVIESFEAGLRSNMVPDRAKAVVLDTSLEDKFLEYLKENDLEGSAEVIDEKLHISVNGISAHGSTPELGVNAACLLTNFFNKVDITNKLLDLINLYLLGEVEGKNMGIDYEDRETGKLTVNTGIVEYFEGKFRIVLNIRYPHGVELDDLVKKLKLVTNASKSKVKVLKHQPGLYVDPNSKLVKTLLEVYKKHTGDKDAKPMVTGGGTFARAMSNSVAFGPHFPGKPTFIHQRNEYIEVEDLLLSVAIYAESLYELAK